MRILVVGASRGIGREIALYLRDRHQVIGVSRSRLDLEGIARIQMDVTTESRWNLGYDYLDAVIICAGTQPPVGPTMSLLRKDWWEGVKNNLYGTFNTIHGTFPYLKRHWADRGKVICFSGGGATKARPNLSSYACAKTAIVRLVETLAAEWQEAEESIDINAIAPGAISTDMTREILSLPVDQTGVVERADAEKTAAQSPVQRAETLKKVCQIVEWLLTHQISGKLLAAQWDDWRSQAGQAFLTKSGNCVLRRVDGHSK